jgi:hypothetical protein
MNDTPVGKRVNQPAPGENAAMQRASNNLEFMKTERHFREQLESLFARCPDLWGFAVREEAQELYVSDIGISPRLSAERYGEIYQDIAQTLLELLEEEPRVGEWLRGRTFARILH